ncbi:Glutathione Reductase [Manis pentadactyla]|nr:Glutathione Reductase [Manis pentadactyla]
MPDASGYVERTETLALRKELGSGSDVTGSARCWNRVMVKCEILTKGLGLALVTLKLMVSAQGEGQIDLDHHGVALVTSTLTLRIQLNGSCLGEGYSVSKIYWNIELHLEFASDTDVREMARLSFMFTLRHDRR